MSLYFFDSVRDLKEYFQNELEELKDQDLPLSNLVSYNLDKFLLKA
jgi:hypothetical protein